MKNIYGFTDEQLDAYKMLMNKENVFLTGEAGTGKTYVLTKFLLSLKDSGLNVVCCAPTGIAALNLQHGTTLHRAFHLPVKTLINEKVKSSKVIENADIIIIDEVSMCRRDVFEHCAKMIMKSSHKNNKHGNKQIIVVGDFFQLSPITTNAEIDIVNHFFQNWGDGFCFFSPYWKEFNFKMINLKEVVRQKDNEFIKNLNLIRIGDKTAFSFFNKLIELDKNKYDPKAIYLTSRNAIVDKINKEKLAELGTKEYVFHADIKGDIKKSDYPTSEELHLKVGARIMMVRNDQDLEVYRNGEMGYVIEIITDKEDIKLKLFLDNGNEIIIDKFHWIIEEPIVKTRIDLNTGEEINYIDTKEIGRFVQFPIRLAYAITIHKSQGQTFEKVVLDPWCFAIGQLYVALSRCTSTKGLQLTRPIRSEYLLTSNDVIDFYSKDNV